MAGTIRDVAQAAGVSKTTVSHALSGRGRLTDATRERVLAVAAQLGYRASIHAQQIVTGRSRSLAVQIANSVDASAARPLVPNSEYFLEILNGASEGAHERSYAVVLVPPDCDLHSLQAFSLDGVLLVDPRGDEPFFSDDWSERPLVTTGRPISPAREVPVVVDNDLVDAARAAVAHLYAAGYRNPALLTTDTSRSYTADMHEGYLRGVAEAGGEPQVVQVRERPAQDGVAKALGEVLALEPQPDAVLTSSESLALGVLQEAHRRGLAVPDDLGVCSAVDSGLLELTTPTITGVYLYPRELGRRAVLALIDLVEDGEARAPVIEIPTRIAARASTARNGAPNVDQGTTSRPR